MLLKGGQRKRPAVSPRPLKLLQLNSQQSFHSRWSKHFSTKLDDD
jgi:hypothetical protein